MSNGLYEAYYVPRGDGKYVFNGKAGAVFYVYRNRVNCDGWIIFSSTVTFTGVVPIVQPADFCKKHA